jgi:hypothetical protein
MSGSVRNTFSDIPLPTNPKDIDIRTLILGLQDIVTENLEKRLIENGYVLFEVLFMVVY